MNFLTVIALTSVAYLQASSVTIDAAPGAGNASGQNIQISIKLRNVPIQMLAEGLSVGSRLDPGKAATVPGEVPLPGLQKDVAAAAAVPPVAAPAPAAVPPVVAPATAPANAAANPSVATAAAAVPPAIAPVVDAAKAAEQPKAPEATAASSKPAKSIPENPKSDAVSQRIKAAIFPNALKRSVTGKV